MIMKYMKKSRLIIARTVILLLALVVGSIFIAVGIGERNPPKLYISTNEDKAKSALIGTYSWNFLGGGVQSDSSHPTEFNYLKDNIIHAVPKERMELKLQSRRNIFFTEYDFDIVEATVFSNKEKISFEALPKMSDRKLHIGIPNIEGEFVYSLLIDFKNKGTVNYGFVVKVEEQEAKKPKDASEIIIPEGKDILNRFIPPEGYDRVGVGNGSYEEYLRSFPLKPNGTPVLYFDGKQKTMDVHEAVLDIDVGNRDLQQCADAVMRLWAEYNYKKGDYEKIHFNFTNGFRADYSKWRRGYGIKFRGNEVTWEKKTYEMKTYKSFREYLDMVFAYAGTLSLSKEMKRVPIEDMQIGDVFLKGSDPGHCVVVVDIAENKNSREKVFMIAQSYMPAQDIHILKNYENEDISPWYSTNFRDQLKTPQWTFNKDQLYRFGD